MDKRMDTWAQERLIESWFPFLAVSQLVSADRRSKDPVYGVHKWFARRPPTLVRALLIASHLKASDTPYEFWGMHSRPGKWLKDAVVYDPFMGGGTSLVESARMGATVFGRDIDPIAVSVVNSELQGTRPDFDTVSADLIAELSTQLKNMFTGPDPDWIPLHWFWLLRPICAKCQKPGLLYKDLIIATSTGQRGAVVRDDAIHAFCPDCLKVHALRAGRKVVDCCGRRRKLSNGTFVRGKYTCPECGEASNHEKLQSGTSERVLVAVEETRPGLHRRIRAATDFDRDLVSEASTAAASIGAHFDVQLQTDRRDRRPVSAGYTSTKTLFTPRQWTLFVRAFDKIRSMDLQADLERELTLMLTGTLVCNNVLCGYARDWGRLAPLFSVRGFSFPALIVELNPFHPTGGRGTFRSARTRMMERVDSRVRRARAAEGQLGRTVVDLPVQAAAVNVICRSADDPADQVECQASVCVTDPPYFDYIAYSELSEFFRVWLREPGLAGAPLLPGTVSPVESFAASLGGALKVTLTRLLPGAPLVFTYHSANPKAWIAIGDAFDIADLAVVALWPVLADPHMGHHAAEGNCEWDVVVVARRKGEVQVLPEDDLRDLPAEWLEKIRASEFSVGLGDQASFKHAWMMSKSRFARLNCYSDLGETPRSSPSMREANINNRSGQ